MRERARSLIAPAVAATLCFVTGASLPDRGRPALPETKVPLTWGDVFVGGGIALIATAAYLFLKGEE